MTFVTVVLIACQSDDVAIDKVESMNPEDVQLHNVGREMPLVEFNAWVLNTDNNLLKTKNVGEINYNLSFVPKEFMAFNELKGQEYNKEAFDVALSHYDGMSYFNFKIAIEEGQGELLKYKLSSAQQYNDRINYMSFKMQKDIFLIQGKDTISPGLFHFERIFEVAPFATVMVAFDNEKFDLQKEFTIVYSDKLFEKGFIKYYYQPKLLIDLPKINSL